MADLSTLANLFVSQAQDPALTAKPSWQDELRKQMDPEAAKRANISSALLAAAAAVGGAKGSPMRGISQGIVAGAQSWDQSKRADQQRRIESMKMLDDADLERRLDRLKLLKDAIGVQGSQEDRTDTRQYQKDTLAVRREEAAARRADAAAKQGGAGTGAGLLAEGEKGDRELSATGGTVGGNASTPAKPKSGADGLAIEKRRALVAARKEFTDWVENNNPSDQEKQKYWDELLDVYQIRDLYQPKKQSNQTQTQSYPAQAADYLKKNPQFRDQFDAKYGAGAAESVLGN